MRSVLLTITTDEGDVLESLEITDPDDLHVLHELISTTVADYLTEED